MSTPSPDGKELELAGQLDAMKANRLINMQEAAKLASAGHDLAKRCAAELKPAFEKLDAEYTTIIDEVKIDLASIGQGIESTLAGAIGTNGSAAEKQFDVLARQNVRSRTARAAAEDSRALLNAYVQESEACQRQCTAIRTERSRLTASEIRA